MPDGTVNVSQPGFWDANYRSGVPPWDLGRAPTVLRNLVASLRDGPQLSVVCPGVGRGHDAFAWARGGHDVLAIDMAPEAINAAADLAVKHQLGLELLQADVLDLATVFGAEFDHRFDVVWEQTCLCTIDPRRRDEYVDTVARLLKPGGSFYALLWHHRDEGGPPWDLAPRYMQALLGRRLEIRSIEPVTQTRRRGEYLLHARLKH